MTEALLAMKSDIRFGFGRNWTKFLSVIDHQRLALAEQSLKTMLDVQDLKGKTFVDVGCGSGLFSLAASRLGARVYSFDYDGASVACTEELKRRYCPFNTEWHITTGSALDSAYLQSLGQFDVVYSWGVLHHTGEMWQAMENVHRLVRSNGKLAIAIYNSQGWTSRYWKWVKRSYNTNSVLKLGMILFHLPYLIGARWVIRMITHRRALERGMSLWYDMIDWLGGYPFEVAKPEEVYAFYHSKGFVLSHLKTCGGRHGCNEFVLLKGALQQ
jgi:2-polyprenyl-6-hydroxyphenyl methylase/3-demethylubiquinone-9 3-methyltransferase